MRKSSNTPKDSNGNDPKETQKGPTPKRRSRSTREEKSFTLHGLALVEFQVSTEDSTQDVEELLIEFYDLDEIVDLPAPEDLMTMLIEDKIFEDCGELHGEVPMKRYVEEGLFLCFETTTETVAGPSPYVGLNVTPKGIEWLKENYGQKAERHLSGMVPEKLKGRAK